MKQKRGAESNAVGHDRKSIERRLGATASKELKPRLGQRGKAGKTATQLNSQQKQRKSPATARGRSSKSFRSSSRGLSRKDRLLALKDEQEQAAKELSQLTQLERQQAKELASLRDRLGSLETEKHGLVSTLKQVCVCVARRKTGCVCASLPPLCRLLHTVLRVLETCRLHAPAGTNL